MQKKRIIRVIVWTTISGLVVGGGIILYLFNMPHRNVTTAPTDQYIASSALVKEYLENPAKANKKYLDEEGDSNIFEVSGTVNEVTEDFDGQQVVLLKKPSDKAGVSCTFTKETNSSAKQLKAGDEVVIKGVIRSGAGYDSDLEMYENVILEKCSLIKK